MNRKPVFDAFRKILGRGFNPSEVRYIDLAFDEAEGVITVTAPKPADKGFEAALKVILKHEGGYANHPRDPGRRTNLGVTQRVWEEWVGRKVDAAEMKALTPAKVAPLYRKNYWKRAGCDHLPDGLALCVFDFAVNSGPSRAVKYLQRIVGAEQDGRFGPATQKAVEDVEAVQGEADMIRRYQDAREQFYRRLETFDVFGKGWLRRNRETTEAALEMAR